MADEYEKKMIDELQKQIDEIEKKLEVNRKKAKENWEIINENKKKIDQQNEQILNFKLEKNKAWENVLLELESISFNYVGYDTIKELKEKTGNELSEEQIKIWLKNSEV
jgi:hypothetical protein